MIPVVIAAKKSSTVALPTQTSARRRVPQHAPRTGCVHVMVSCGCMKGTAAGEAAGTCTRGIVAAGPAGANAFSPFAQYSSIEAATAFFVGNDILAERCETQPSNSSQIAYGTA